MANLRVVVENSDASKLLIKFIGDFSAFHLLKSQIFKAIEGVKQGSVIWDLSEVSYMDSMGISALMDFHQKLAKLGLKFEVRRPSPKIRQLLKLVRVDGVLNVTD